MQDSFPSFPPVESVEQIPSTIECLTNNPSVWCLIGDACINSNSIVKIVVKSYLSYSPSISTLLPLRLAYSSLVLI